MCTKDLSHPNGECDKKCKYNGNGKCRCVERWLQKYYAEYEDDE